MSRWLLDKATALLGRRSTRRDFLTRTAIIGTAVSVAPLRYLLHPESAYAVVLSPTRLCPPGSVCYADAFAAMCCSLNEGVNACPVGTFAGGWWKADGSVYCAGPRYYIDCVATCSRCTTGCDTTGFCPSCDALGTCDCAKGDCNERRTACRTFRYGQCHQEIACCGRLSCRVVSCTPAWLLDPSCTTSSATDDLTANQTAPCLLNPLPPPIVGMSPAVDGRGYWLAAADGGVFAYGSAHFAGSAGGISLNHPVVGMAVDRGSGGYWLVGSDGGIFAYGAPFDGSAGAIRLNAGIVAMAATPGGGGYWLVASDGGVFTYGNAAFHGSMGGQQLNEPIVGMAATPSGQGYWMVASDGGIFTFGDAVFRGSTGGIVLNEPIVAMAATPSGRGYWMVARDGGLFAFGDAEFHGSMGGVRLAVPISGMASTQSGHGYWLVSADGRVFPFGDAVFYGSRSGQIRTPGP
jgi:hypothetical protein